MSRLLPAPRVWAPLPRSVELDLRDRRVPMRRIPAEGYGGWWQTLTPLALPPGTDYAFVLDGADPLPDPRSPSQPDGVHGFSRTVDHEAFGWTDGGWQPPAFEHGVVYELHVGTFTPEGTFETAIGRLDHLAGLGITHVELMPVAEFDGTRGWGYDGVDLFAPEHAYGGADGLKRLVDACHARGLAVLLDVVYNHLGPSGNYLARFGPYFSGRYRVPWGEAINYDGPGSDEVRAFIVDNAVGWLRDYHVDGLRLDAVHAMFDQSAVHILEELSVAVDAFEARTGRACVLVAESDLNDPRLVRPRELGGYGLDALWNDDFHHALHTTFTGERHAYYASFTGLRDLATAIERGFVLSGVYSPNRGRRHGRPPENVPATRFVGYLQNHDQAGNRALGERTSQLLGPDALKLAAAFVLLAPFVPLLFAGEEWAASTPFLFFTDHADELGEAIRKGRRADFAAFGWPEEEVPDPQAAETFERSKLRWDETGLQTHAGVLAWHRELIDLRKRLPELSDGRYPRVRCDEAGGWLVVERPGVLVACNFAVEAREITVPNGLSLQLESPGGARLGHGRLTLPAMGVAVLLAASGSRTNGAETDTMPEAKEADICPEKGQPSGTGLLDRFTVLAGGLDHPEGVAWDPVTERVYAGGEAGQVYAIGLDGSVSQVASTGGFLLGVAVDAAGRVYGCDVGRAEVVRVDPATGDVETYSRGDPGLAMRAPNWLAFDRTGRLFVTDSGDWGKGDGFIWVVEPDRSAIAWATESRLLPNGCCLDLGGSSLFVVETNLPGVVRIPIRPDGGAGKREIWVEMPGSTPDGVAIAADGTLLVSCYRPDRIYAISPSRRIEVLADDPHGQMFGGPANVAFAGEDLDRIVTSNLGRWHVTVGDVGLRGPGLPRPDLP